MPVITIGSIKGGVGKTTVATNFAVLCAHQPSSVAPWGDVLLVDADWQENASDFSELRASNNEGDAGYTCIRLQGMQVKTQVRKLREKYPIILIDAGGRDSVSQRAAISVSDFLLVPFLPRTFDLWTAAPLLEVIDDTLPANESLRTFFFLNRGDPFGSDMDDAYTYLREATEGRTDTKVLHDSLGNRKAFAVAAARGLAVTELKPKEDKSENEMLTLFANFFREIHGNSKKARA